MYCAPWVVQMAMCACDLLERVVATSDTEIFTVRVWVCEMTDVLRE